MHIILFLLKILGILLLCLVVLFLIILFHPIFYKISGKIEEKAIIQGKIWWLFRIIGVDIFLNGTSYSYAVKLFGKRILSDEKTEPEDASEDESENGLVENTERTASNGKERSANTNASMAKPVKAMEPAQQKEEISTEKISVVDEQKLTIKEKNFGFKATLIRIKEKISSILELISKIKTEYKDEKNRQAMLHVWNEVLYILSKLKPKYVKARLQYGTEDPALTGQITGVLSLLPWIYKFDAHIYPDFLADKMYIQGEFSMKGHVFPWHALLVAIRLFKDRNIRRMIHRMKKLGGNS